MRLFGCCPALHAASNFDGRWRFVVSKTVWMVCGNRGGVGKTLAALGLISVLMRAKRRVSVLDGDGRSPDVAEAANRKIPSRIADFRRLRPDLYDDMTVFDYESIVSNLAMVSSDVVINTPDGCDDVLLRWFDETLRFTEKSRVEFRLLYLMNHRPNGLDILPAMASRFALLFPLRNLYFGPESSFEAFNQEYAGIFRDVFEFPQLRDREVAALLDGKYLPHEFVETNASHLLARQRVADWLAAVTCVISDVMQIDSANSLVEPLYPTPAAASGVVPGGFVGG